jgi:Holliday junction resolvasome RuvABC endonuclease subunit
MNKINPNNFRILAIAPTFRGVGFAVLEERDTLVDWGVKRVYGDKNTNSVAKVKELIAQYSPDVLVLPDTLSKDVRRYPRIKALCKKIVAVATTQKTEVALLSKQQVKRVFFADGEGTKHALAEIIAKRFPEELASRLPPERKAWVCEHYQMDIFDAVALALAVRGCAIQQTANMVN